ncbi:MAG: TonB-dependent receptor [Paludibacteraceae bacterium]|nr:TonB-dependent receptor [Paludibacteraceae bacterium]
MKRILLSCFLFCLSQAFCLAGVPNVLEQVDDSTYIQTLGQIDVTAMHSGVADPVAQTTIGIEELNKTNSAEDIPYILQNSVSVIATSDAGNGVGYTDVRMRGYDGTRINVTVGDVPLNDAESHKVYWVDTPDLIQSADNVQINRGAVTSSTGTGAFGGSINLESKKFSEKFGGKVTALYGSYNTNKELVNITSGLLKEKWAIEGMLSHTGSDGYMERASTELGSYMIQAGYIGSATKVKLLSFGGVEHTYNAWDGITKEQMAKNRRYNPCGEIKDDNGNVISFYDNQKDNYIQTNNHIIITHNFNAHWGLNATAHYTYGNGWYDQYKNARTLSEYTLYNMYDSDGNPVTKSNLTREKRQESHFGGLIAYAVYKNRRVTTDFGVSWNTYSSLHKGYVTNVFKAANFNGNYEYYRNNSLKHDVSVFAKVNWEAFNGFNIYADVQYRYVNYAINGLNDVYDYKKGGMQGIDIKKLYNFVNPKVGVSYRFCKYNKVYASASMANREPTRRDLVNAIAEVQPKTERLYDVECGYSVEHKWIKGSVNLYYMIYKDQLVLTGEQNPDTYEALYMNIDNSYRRGIEIEAIATPIKCLWFGGNVTLSQNKAIDYGTELSYSPSVIATIKAGVDTNGFSAVWDTRYVGRQYITNYSESNLTIDAYWVTNLSLGYEFNVKNACKIHFGVALNNLFNAEYCANASSYDGEAYYFPQAKFNATGNVTVSF